MTLAGIDLVPEHRRLLQHRGVARGRPRQLDLDRLQPGAGLLHVAGRALAAGPRHGDRRARATGGRRTAARRRWSRCGCGSRRRPRSPTARTSSPTGASRARMRSIVVVVERRRRRATTASALPAQRRGREDVEDGVGRRLSGRSRSRAAASARTRAGRAPASPGGTRASPRGRPRRPRRPRPRRLGAGSRRVGLVLGSTGADAARRRRGRRRLVVGLRVLVGSARRRARRRPARSAARRARPRSVLVLDRVLVLDDGRLRGSAGRGPRASRLLALRPPLGSAPCRRLSSRCSRMASSSSPIAPERLATPARRGVTPPARCGSCPRAWPRRAPRRRRRSARPCRRRSPGSAAAPKARGDARARPLPSSSGMSSASIALADALGELVGALEVGLGQHDGELLAAVAGGLVDLARGLAQHARDLAQHDVALLVAVGVVDRLKSSMSSMTSPRSARSAWRARPRRPSPPGSGGGWTGR